jgi:hypothetical protein
MLGVSFCRPSLLCMSNWPLSQSHVLYKVMSKVSGKHLSPLSLGILFLSYMIFSMTYTSNNRMQTERR